MAIFDEESQSVPFVSILQFLHSRDSIKMEYYVARNIWLCTARLVLQNTEGKY